MPRESVTLSPDSEEYRRILEQAKRCDADSLKRLDTTLREMLRGLESLRIPDLKRRPRSLRRWVEDALEMNPSSAAATVYVVAFLIILFGAAVWLNVRAIAEAFR